VEAAGASSWAAGSEKFCPENPKAKGVVLESHGLFTWGDTPKELLRERPSTINKAIAWFEKETKGKPPFGGLPRNP
jgi:rhamnose utilization protein RhaD (predicted bifunctional aldolase and dehydrogenase)